jgi:ABC-type multidrug transport system ATPase subunit
MQTAIRSQITEPKTIVIKGLNYSYKGLEVFRDFTLEAGSKTTVLRGASGSGKTTLLKLLSGNLIPDSFEAMPASDNCCLVLQEDSLFPWLTGLENVSKLTKIPITEFQKHPMYHLISSFVERKACRMSYGQRRLTELFRAIIYRPQFLYLDEPFNFLDERNIGLVLPFLQGEFMSETNLVLSNHHNEGLTLLESATIFQFDGTFPITQLRRVN